jgi:hypothetical protein
MFIDRNSIADDRARFANYCCQLLWNSYGGNIHTVMEHMEPLYNYLEEHVRNVYQFIGDQIPLLHYYELLKYGPEGFDIFPEDFEGYKERVADACFRYYVMEGDADVPFS